MTYTARGFPYDSCSSNFLFCAFTLVVACILKSSALVKEFESPYVALKKECPPGCEKNGNCNVEEGRCECPWGFSGPACEVSSMAACRSGPEDPGSCGVYFPKNCECYKRCYELYCRYGGDTNRCDHELGQMLPGTPCYTFDAKPLAEQTSAIPVKGTPGVSWYQVAHDAGPFPGLRPIQQADSQYKAGGMHGDAAALTPDKCPDSCSGHGVCKQWNHPGSQPECLCHKGWNSSNCGMRDDHEACWFNPTCSGRGVCRSAFCHCKPGYFGMGCHRSQAFQPAVQGRVAPPNRSRLKIYMYELPWEVTFPYDYNDGAFGRENTYTAYEHFLRWFLEDTEVRTENPHEATLFYIPMLSYFYIGNVRDPQWHMEHVLQHIRDKYPYWNRTGGRDHFYLIGGDQGACYIPYWMQQTAIKVVHFGVHMSGLQEMWPGTNTNNTYGCIQPERDVVVPPLTLGAWTPYKAEEFYQKEVVAVNGYQPKRDLLFFFAGGVHMGELKYSGGARQAIYSVLKVEKPTDVKFVEGRTDDYEKLMFRSKFCIAPYGWGWGGRLVQAMHKACIPVIIQDHTLQSFDEVLPFDEFSVRLSLSQVPRILHILRSFTDDDLARMRMGMARFYKAFIWEKSCGGEAYKYTLMALHKRAHNAWGGYYRRALQATP